MQKLSNLTESETVLSNKITRNKIVPSFKDSPRKPLRRRGDLIQYFPVCFRKWWWCQNSDCYGRNTGLDFKACTWLRDFLPIVPKIAVRQTVGGRGAAEGNSNSCKPFSPNST